MADAPVWDVNLYVDGPITVKRRVITTQQKGFRCIGRFTQRVSASSMWPKKKTAALCAIAWSGALAVTVAFSPDGMPDISMSL